MNSAHHLLLRLLFSDDEQSQLYRSVEEAQSILVDIGGNDDAGVRGDGGTDDSAGSHASEGSDGIKHIPKAVDTALESPHGAKVIDKQAISLLHRGLNSAFILAGIMQPSHRKILLKMCRSVQSCNHKALSDHGNALLKLYPTYRAEMAQIVKDIKKHWRDGEPPQHNNRDDIDIVYSELPPAVRDIFKTYSLFFPQGAKLLTTDSQQQYKAQLRKYRTVKVVSKNSARLTQPLKQILFTSNVLMTIPNQHSDLQRYPKRLQQQIHSVAQEPQRYWYDHPIAIGAATQHNELIYGLRGLSNMVQYEIEHRQLPHDTCISVLLSVSTTHEGLRPIVADIIRHDIADSEPIPHINAWIITEKECRDIIDTIVVPTVANRGGVTVGRLRRDLTSMFGVDGEYGRHYTTLKAIAPLWSMLKDDSITATFKIDLDQVFPQQQLVNETGRSAAEHFMTDRWGAEGIDCNGRSVHLGLIAGALVNEQDIKHGLFTPDVRYNLEEVHQLSLPQRIFNTILPQSISTEVEMGDNRLPETDRTIAYDSHIDSAINDASSYVLQQDSIHRTEDQSVLARQRVHVTGGTNGITTVALRRFRPFTPIDCGRAEDQAYLLSVLYKPTKAVDGKHSQFLRYVHQPGLIMRHDKSSLIPATLKATKIPNKIGDIVRILFYSSYARIVPGRMRQVMKEMNPFTGSFISLIPHALGYLTWALSIEQHFSCSEYDEAMQFISEGVKRLPIAHIRFTPAQQRKSYVFHRNAWDKYYYSLDKLEQHKANNTKLFLRCRDMYADILKPVRIL